MNNEQEIDHNVLAEWLNDVNKKIEPYSKLIAVLVGAVVLGLIAWGFYRSDQSNQRSFATLQLLTGNGDVTTEYPDTPAAAWAVLYQGNKDLQTGIDALYSDRSDAETMLTQAKESFNTALGQSDDKLLNSRAYLGIALASESMGDLDAATEAYKQCIDMNESKEMVNKAQRRIDELSQPETKEFVAWFAEQDFSPADPSMPPTLPGGSSLPDLPDLKLPTLGTDGDEASDQMELEDTGLELPGDSKPADTKAGGTEAVDTKAVDTKAADMKADDTKATGTEAADKKTTETTEAESDSTFQDKAKKAAEDGSKAASEVAEKAADKAKEAVETATEKSE